MIEFNEFQSTLESLNYDSLPDETKDKFMECITCIPFISYMISPNRKRAKDLPRDKEGRIIVDICHPHILEDMDYFRPSAIHFQKYGCYTKLRPNGNPNSEFGKWVKEEVRRCWEGYVRPSDGEWVTGELYFYLNYSPMELTRVRKGTKIGDRVHDFPDVWDGVYLRYHYQWQARNGGLYDKMGGHHCFELASRGKSKSYCASSQLSRIFTVGDSAETCKGVKAIITAYQKEYLTKDATLNKFESNIDFLAQHTEFPRHRLQSSLDKMSWQMGYIDLNTGTKKGTLNTIYGVTSKDNADKLRGKRPIKILLEEAGCHLKGTEVLMYDRSVRKVEDIKAGDSIMGDDFTSRKVLKTFSGTDEMYKITLANGDVQIVNSSHPVYYFRRDWTKGTVIACTGTAPELMDDKYIGKGLYIRKAVHEFSYKNIDIDPYLLGLWLGDGDSTRVSIANEDTEVLDWLKSNYPQGNIRDLSQSKTCKIFSVSNKDSLFDLFKKNGLINNKHVPENYIFNSREVQLNLIAGLIDTDGTLSIKEHGRRFEITQRYDRLHILKAVKFMAESLGLRCSISSRIGTGKKPGVLHYRLRIGGDINIIPTRIKRKQAPELQHSHRSRLIWNDYSFRIEPYGKGEYYGFTVDGNNLFLLSDLTIVHNTFPKLKEIYATILPSVEEGDFSFGQISGFGTSGDPKSDFTAMQEFMYNPLGYNMYALPNVFDINPTKFFVWFYGAYLNRKDCYDHNGNSDVTKALVSILNARYFKKYNSTDLNAVSKLIAEQPITPREAIIRNATNIFPVQLLIDRLTELDNNPREYDDVFVGKLVLNKKGIVDFLPTNDMPIREFPTKDNKVYGAIEIYKKPEVNKATGFVYNNRYISGIDPFDQDASDTMSLGSIFVFDLWTDSIVCEYTGRPDMADDFYEICRLILLYYNARANYENNLKGIYGYFSKMNCLYLLTETLQFLKDRDMIKGEKIGNTARGTNATTAINNYADSRLREWLLTPKVHTIKQDDNEVEVTLNNCAFLRNRALIKEMIAYNPDINVDRIRAMGMLMLLREDRIIYGGGKINKGQTNDKYLGNDKYFINNYNSIKKLHNKGSIQI